MSGRPQGRRPTRAWGIPLLSALLAGACLAPGIDPDLLLRDADKIHDLVLRSTASELPEPRIICLGIGEPDDFDQPSPYLLRSVADVEPAVKSVMDCRLEGSTIVDRESGAAALALYLASPESHSGQLARVEMVLYSSAVTEEVRLCLVEPQDTEWRVEKCERRN